MRQIVEWALCVALSILATIPVAQSVEPPDLYDLKPATYPFNRSELLTFDPYEVCKSPTQSPNCVAKTVWGCQFPAGPAADCIRVGLTAIQKKPDWLYPSDEIQLNDKRYQAAMRAQHWRQKWRELDWPVRGALINIRPMLLRTVGADRFKADPPLLPELVGTHEMIIYAGENLYSLDGKIGMSIFMKQVDGKWRATSYSYNGYKAERDDSAGRTEAFFEQCEDYGCGQSPFATHKTAPRRTAEECKGKMCAYRALGIQKPIIPIPDKQAFVIIPIFMPGIELECTHKDKHPLCKW